MTKVFAFGLAVFSGAFLLAMVLSVCLLTVDQAALSSIQPVEYLALAALLIIPFFGLSTAFRALASAKPLGSDNPLACKLGHILMALGLLGLYTRLVAVGGHSALPLPAIQIAALICLFLGSLVLWRLRDQA